MMGGVGWITPQSLTTLTLMEFYICHECRISHLKEVDTLHEWILIKEYATITFWQIIQNNTPRDTQAIFHFMGPLNSNSTRFIFGKSGSACLNISNVLRKGKRCLYFHTFCLCLYLHILEIKIFNILFCFNSFGISFYFTFITFNCDFHSLCRNLE